MNPFRTIVTWLFLVLVFSVGAVNAWGQQKASIRESNVVLKTYPFSDPDPVPIIVSNPKIYPYFRYEGYSHDSEEREWKVVTLENDYIEVYVLPEVGGKVWGAVEKSGGEEFIYRNEVMKFRNISMRGPWTSGGIEFNFGIIGHHPSTATPVDYKIRENDDGSVSCIVGNIDLPSRTQWRVEVRLPADKAYFETRVIWYNPTNLTQSYYNWMTAAAFAQGDLVFYCPGDQYLTHPGKAYPWPIDAEGRDLSIYAENNFGPSKSYHVVGVYEDFFGGYFEQDNYGFGHWAPYEEMPGQKLWLWALSRSGGIWEDLLTDTDGQYIEFQAGRLFDQFFPGEDETVLTQTAFEPGQVDIWRELWFPVKGIGGLTSVSQKGVLHANLRDDQLQIGLNVFQMDSSTLQVYQDTVLVYQEEVRLDPLEPFLHTIPWDGSNFRVEVTEWDLQASSDPSHKDLARPFDPDPDYDVNANLAERLHRRAWEALKYREIDKAAELWSACLDQDEFHLGALQGMAELCLHWAQYPDGLDYIQKALRIDTYDPQSNYLAASIHDKLNDKVNALECYGWAARSPQYRADAFSRIATLHLRDRQYDQAQRYARNALDFNRFHLGARQVLAVVSRMRGSTISSVQQIATMLAIDPLNHFAHFEQYLLSPTEQLKEKVMQSHQSELPYQTFLELAINYVNLGRSADALVVLDQAPQHPLVDLWWSYLHRDSMQISDNPYMSDLSELSPAQVFPYRQETLPVMEWAAGKTDDWHVQYYLALNYWGVGRKSKAYEILKSLGEEPDYYAFYLTRAQLAEQRGESNILSDLNRAHHLGPDDWRTWKELIRQYRRNAQYSEMLKYAQESAEKFPGNYSLGMDHADALLLSGKPGEAISILRRQNVLPFEGASAGRSLWEDAHQQFALTLSEQGDFTGVVEVAEAGKSWPESLGVGRPYVVDERIFDYQLASAHQQLGDETARDKALDRIVQFTRDNWQKPSFNHILGLSVIEHREGSQEVARLFESLSSDMPDSNVYRWLEAFIAEDQEQIREIESDGGVDKDQLTFLKKCLLNDPLK